MTDVVFNWVLFGASLPVIGALVCRLDMMTYRHTKAVIIVFHVALIVAVAGAARYAWDGAAGLTSVAVVAAATCWLIFSWRTWSHGKVPDHFTKPVEFSDAPIERVWD